MELVLIATAIMVFIIIPACWVYDMIVHPEEFGGTKLRFCEAPEYKRDLYDDFIEASLVWSSYIVRIPHNVYKGIEWVLHAEFMTTKES